MTIDKSGSFINEPAVSEHSLQKRIEALVEHMPLNERTSVVRSVSFDDELLHDIDFRRSKKEIQASLDHQIDNGMNVTFRYNPRWNALEARSLVFPLPGTSALEGHLELDIDSASYASYLYDEESDVQIARQPVQLATIDTLLYRTGTTPRLPLSGQPLAPAIFAAAQPGEKLTVHKEHVLFAHEDENEDISSTCEVHREQIYSDDDILDIIEFIIQIHTGNASHARVVKIIHSQHGSTLLAEEASHDYATDESTHRTLQLDYDTLERLIKQVDEVRIKGESDF